MKVCTKCKEEKDESMFGKNKTNKDGLNCWCKVCTKQHREVNREKIAEYKKQYSENNKEKIAAHKKLYYENNKEKIAERGKQYREENKDTISEKKKKYQKENNEKIKEYSKKYYKNNRDSILECRKQYRKDNKEQIREYKKEYRRNHKKSILLRDRNYRDSHKKEAVIYQKQYRASNKQHAKEYQEKYHKLNGKKIATYCRERRLSDTSFKICCNLRSRLNTALKQNYKSGSAVRDLGCSIGELKLYLSSKFQPGMTWENYGKWHIDHILPLSKFDLTDRNQLLKACHYTNLQPLWAKDNLKKGNRT